jgi:hypothetical protein
LVTEKIEGETKYQARRLLLPETHQTRRTVSCPTLSGRLSRGARHFSGSSAKSVLLLLLTYRRDETMVKPPAAGLDRIF